MSFTGKNKKVQIKEQLIYLNYIMNPNLTFRVLLVYLSYYSQEPTSSGKSTVVLTTQLFPSWILNECPPVSDAQLTSKMAAETQLNPTV